MPSEDARPREYDAVLGGQNSTPRYAAVLGGIAGVKSRLASPDVEVRIAALCDAPKYGDAGLDLIIAALQDESMSVQSAACSLLKDRDEQKIKSHFQDYLPAFEFDVVTVNAYGKENSRSHSFARFFPEDLGNSIVLEMVGIYGSTFMMGSSASEAGVNYQENPRHRVTLPAFFAGKYPITQAQWKSVMGNNPSYFKGEKRPVECVSWNMAVEFCGKLSQKTGKKYRLLSEAEWEYACRAGTTSPFHFGETITTDLVNHKGSKSYAKAPRGLYREQTTDVGSFPPNGFGLYDMHGNVWEWCSDNWHDSYNGAPTDGSSWEIDTNDFRVLRGGCWYNDADYCRSSKRVWCSPDDDNSGFGFRVAVVFV